MSIDRMNSIVDRISSLIKIREGEFCRDYSGLCASKSCVEVSDYASITVFFEKNKIKFKRNFPTDPITPWESASRIEKVAIAESLNDIEEVMVRDMNSIITRGNRVLGGES